MHQDPSGSGPKPYDERKDVVTYKGSQGEDDPIQGKVTIDLVTLERDLDDMLMQL